MPHASTKLIHDLVVVVVVGEKLPIEYVVVVGVFGGGGSGPAASHPRIRGGCGGLPESRHPHTHHAAYYSLRILPLDSLALCLIRIQNIECCLGVRGSPVNVRCVSRLLSRTQ